MASTVRRAGRRRGVLTDTDRWMLGFWLVNLAVFLHVVAVDLPLWVTYAYNALLYCLGALLSYYSRTVRRVFVLGTVAGVVELGVDHFLVEHAGVLVYPDALPMLVSSPAYMPLAWAIVVTQLGYLGVRLGERYGRAAAAVGPAVTAVVLVGFYEYGAFYAGIWAYERAPLALLGHVPLFIVAAEGVMFGLLHEVARRFQPVAAGVAFGLVVTASYVASYVAFAAVGG